METEKTAVEENPEQGGRKGTAKLLAPLLRVLQSLALLALAAVVAVLVIFLVRTGGKWGMVSGGFLAAFAGVSFLALTPRRDR